jgi:replication factor C small subunit
MSLEDHVWTERHRPDSLEEVIGQEAQVERMKKWVDDESMPHLLLHGPAGTGKTASAVAFAKEKYGDNWRSNLIEMNASDDRGIDVVREQIKSVAQQSASGEYGYKIIYLDEADNLTKDAQAALRRVMEEYTDQTRFILSCNYPSKLIDPIQSRCTPLPFRRLDNPEIEELITRILEKEGIEYEESAVSKIVEYVEGDARRAVHTLQTSVQDGKLTEDIIQVVGGQVEDEVVEEMISDALNGEMEDAHELVVTEVLPNVTDYSRFVGTLMSKIQDSDELPRDVKFYSLSQLGDLERNIMEGCNPHVQINSFLSKLPVVRYSSIPTYEGQE